MEYIYAAMLLHKAGKEINEQNLTQVLTAAGMNVDAVRVKALVASLAEVKIDEAIKSAPTMMAATAAAPAAVAPAACAQAGAASDAPSAPTALAAAAWVRIWRRLKDVMRCLAKRWQVVERARAACTGMPGPAAGECRTA